MCICDGRGALSRAMILCVAFLAQPAVAASVGGENTGGSACPQIMAMPFRMNLVGRYPDNDPTKARIDPEKNKVQGPRRHAGMLPADTVVSLADRIVRENDPHEKERLTNCVDRAFEKFAGARSLLGAHSSVDNFYRSWILSRLAIAYMKVHGTDRDNMPIAVRRWFYDNMIDLIVFQKMRLAQGHIQNHLYWGGFAAASVGELLDDRDMKSFSRTILNVGLSAVDGNGFLSAELRRGDRARHYHMFAAEALAGIALLDQGELTPIQRAAFHRLAVATISSFCEPNGGKLGRAARAPQSADTKLTGLLLLRPFLTSADERATLAKVTQSTSHTHPFLGGDIGFLLSRTGQATETQKRARSRH